MKTTDRILNKIKREGAITAKKLSQDLSMTTMGARQHLQSLEDEGFLDFDDIKAKVGRPTRHWALTDKGHAQFFDGHSDLMINMIDAVESVFGKEGMEKVTAEREATTLRQYQTAMAHCKTLEEKLNVLTELRDSEGYMVELLKNEQGFELIENHCPICRAAKRCPNLCLSELNVFRKLLGKDYSVTRTEHIIQGKRRCSYQISPH
ncbi:transcriptional regulator [Vibrio penaeicida]|uniref:helix-turn-helix transcriptional regulator n=1 Tax=Vibrio penaeicida TaxID=104609 RepID=UPI002733B4A6|nr:metalloregulator ArsR/SmtB family transcription factor [Vibrio penaeicida]MDP2573156.1 transcriptional regulator [Vibrio penaeicida]